MVSIAKCPLCGTELIYKNISKGNAQGIVMALIVLFLGIGISLTGIGAIIGIPLCIYALGMGGKRSKVLFCPNCKSVHEAL
jgi:ssDNA-binding Zn-finger/Zn-ribbon topoisomerase 1